MRPVRGLHFQPGNPRRRGRAGATARRPPARPVRPACASPADRCGGAAGRSIDTALAGGRAPHHRPVGLLRLAGGERGLTPRAGSRGAAPPPGSRRYRRPAGAPATARRAGATGRRSSPRRSRPRAARHARAGPPACRAPRSARRGTAPGSPLRRSPRASPQAQPGGGVQPSQLAPAAPPSSTWCGRRRAAPRSARRTAAPPG